MTPASDSGDARLRSPAFPRNIGPITEALRPLLQGVRGRALELAAGPGEHALALARAFPDLLWTPSDPDPASVASIAAWRAAEGPANLADPRRIDAGSDWTAQAADLAPLALALAINVTHIAPWPVTEGLVAGAARLLDANGVLALYGPFFEDGVETAPTNSAFDESLRTRDPAWGLRRLEDVDVLAQAAGLEGPAVARLPANNLLVAWRAPG